MTRAGHGAANQMQGVCVCVGGGGRHWGAGPCSLNARVKALAVLACIATR